MEQQPPNSGDGRSREDDRGNANEHFVVEPEPPRRRRRWLSTDEQREAAGEAYRTRQFDLSSLPDISEVEAGGETQQSTDNSAAGSGPPAKADQLLPPAHVSKPRRVRKKPIERPAEQPPAPPAGHDETPPLGFVSEPRPVQRDNLLPEDAQLGFINRPGATPAGPAGSSRPEPAGEAPALSDTAAVDGPLDVQAPDADLTPGQMLRQARSERGLTAEDIALRTRMPLETVLALEEDRDPEQSAWVYVRGFYRRYARTLEIPDAPLLEAHARMAGEQQPGPQPVASEWAPQDVSPPPSAVPKMLFVMLTSIVLGVAAWWFGPRVGAWFDHLNLPQKAGSAYSGMKSAAVSARDRSAELMGSAAETVKTQGAAMVDTASEQYNKAAEKVKTEAQPLVEAARAQREVMRQQDNGDAAPAGTPPATKPAQEQVSAPAPLVTAAAADSEPAPATMAETDQAAATSEKETGAATEGSSGQPEPAPELQPQAQGAEPMIEPEAAGPLDVASSEGMAVTEEAGTTAAAPAAVLELEFSRQTWLSVSDGNGLVLFEDMVEGGTTKRFDGEPPLTLFLGTATAANAYFNGQPVNIASQMRSNGTARILLGEQ